MAGARSAGGLGLPPGAGTAVVRAPSHVRAVAGGCEFRWDGLTVGLHDLELAAVGAGDVCLRVPGILVGPGECTDGRLQRISLAALARSVRVRLRGPGGLALARELSGVLVAEPNGAGVGEPSVVPVVARDAEFVFLAALAADTIRLCLEGYAPVELPRGAAHPTVDLAARAAVEVDVRRGAADKR